MTELLQCGKVEEPAAVAAVTHLTAAAARLTAAAADAVAAAEVLGCSAARRRVLS